MSRICPQKSLEWFDDASSPHGPRLQDRAQQGPIWYAKYRLPSGRQVQKKLGPAWSGRGRPPAGYFTKRLAQVWLDDVLASARRNELPGMIVTGATLADAAAEWLRYCEYDRAVKRSTLTEYRHTAERIVRDLGDLPIDEVTPELLERWKSTLALSNRTVAKYLVILPRQLHIADPA